MKFDLMFFVYLVLASIVGAGITGYIGWDKPYSSRFGN